MSLRRREENWNEFERTLPPTPVGTMRYVHSNGRKVLTLVTSDTPAKLADGDELTIDNLPWRFRRAWNLPKGVLKATVTRTWHYNKRVFRIETSPGSREYAEIPLRQMSRKAEMVRAT